MVRRREWMKGAALSALAMPWVSRAGSMRRKPVRSVIELWIWGGPSHLETFDPKPAAGAAYNGGFGDIPTNVEGIRLSSFLPRLAKQMDQFSIIRSLCHGTNGHETATYLMQTGRMPGDGITYPAIGAVMAMMKGAAYHGKLPPYIALTTNKGRFSENGFLSDRYKPLATGSNPNGAQFLVDGFVPPGGVTPAQMKRRIETAQTLDRFGKGVQAAALAQFDQAGRSAQEVMTGKDVQAFDLRLESNATREKYGRTRFGQCCLAARRLVEAGVPYITINAQGWDTHKKHFEAMQRLGPEFDQGFAALLSDLKERNLLETTLVWCTGEFGRTPKVDMQEPWNGGRNHYCSCFSAAVAGGGFAGGRVLGASDAQGAYPIERPVHPVDLLWSLYELAGIDPAGKLKNPRGLDLTILPPEGGKNRLVELYKEGGPA